MLKKWYTFFIDMQFDDINQQGFDAAGAESAATEDAVWKQLLDPARYAVPRAKARPNKFLAIGLHFYAGIRASRE